jgi:hypothetical protein
LTAVLVGGALAGGCGSGTNTTSVPATVPTVAGGLLLPGKTSVPPAATTTAPKTAPPGGASSGTRQRVLERLAKACREGKKVAPSLSASRNQEICKQLRLIP